MRVWGVPDPPATTRVTSEIFINPMRNFRRRGGDTTLCQLMWFHTEVVVKMHVVTCQCVVAAATKSSDFKMMMMMTMMMMSTDVITLLSLAQFSLQEDAICASAFHRLSTGALPLDSTG